MANQIIATKTCTVCGQTGTVEVSASEYLAYVAYSNGQGPRLIQDALPTLDFDKREQIISGTHPVCWDKIFGELETLEAEYPDA